MTSAAYSHLRKQLFDFRLFLCNNLVAFTPIWNVRRCFYRMVMGFELESGCFVMQGAHFDALRHLRIGKRTVINRDCQLDNRGGVFIGSDVLLSPGVMIITADHDVQASDCIGRTRPVNIANHVFIGSRAMILPGVDIGEGAVVCAGAVVTKNIPPFAIFGGVPASQIGTRNSELSYQTNYFRYFA